MEATQAREVFARTGIRQRDCMFKRGNRLGRGLVLLATCFCLFTFAQTARPLESVALLSHAGIATRYHKLTRHTLTEVGGGTADLSAEARTEFGEPTPEISPRRSTLSQAGELPVWPAHEVVHRRILPSPPDDAH
jgi:hypothetical protein